MEFIAQGWQEGIFQTGTVHYFEAGRSICGHESRAVFGPAAASSEKNRSLHCSECKRLIEEIRVLRRSNDQVNEILGIS